MPGSCLSRRPGLEISYCPVNDLGSRAEGDRPSEKGAQRSPVMELVPFRRGGLMFRGFLRVAFCE